MQLQTIVSVTVHCVQYTWQTTKKGHRHHVYNDIDVFEARDIEIW